MYGLITTSDDGGNTGKFKEQYDTSALGDITKNIVALIDESNNVNVKFLEACDYRYPDGFLKGCTLRNILMATFEL